jgi:D-amino peptidase
MEGAAGVVHVDQTRRSGSDFERARRWMTEEAHAAALGAFDAGASAVLVNDSHADMRNLLPELLDPRCEIVSGSLKPGSMVEAVAGHDCALFVGYHAGGGTRAAILDHTYAGRVAARVRVGGQAMSETGLNAAVAGHHGVPVVLVTGDRATCDGARALLPEVETVAVKEALSRTAARSLHPQEACARIREGARRAVTRAAGIPPFRLGGPLELEVDLLSSAYADACELLPGTERRGALTVAYHAPDAPTLLRVLVAYTHLAMSQLV